MNICEKIDPDTTARRCIYDASHDRCLWSMVAATLWWILLVWSLLALPVSNHFRSIVISHHRVEIYWSFDVFWCIFMKYTMHIGYLGKHRLLLHAQYGHARNLAQGSSFLRLAVVFDRCRADHILCGNFTGTGAMPMKHPGYIWGSWLYELKTGINCIRNV